MAWRGGGGHDFRAMLGSLWYDPELEAKLREQMALQALEMQLESGSLAVATMSAEQWVADIGSWAASHRSLPREADDSRESI